MSLKLFRKKQKNFQKFWTSIYVTIDDEDDDEEDDDEEGDDDDDDEEEGDDDDEEGDDDDEEGDDDDEDDDEDDDWRWLNSFLLQCIIVFHLKVLWQKFDMTMQYVIVISIWLVVILHFSAMKNYRLL